MIAIRMKVEGLDKMRKIVQAAKERAKGSVDFSSYVASRAYSECMKHFREEQGPDGQWEPLSPVTIARRRGGGGGAKILQDTGRLRASILFRAFKNMAVVFTNMIYGPTHQKGDTQKNIPARPFLWVADEFLGKMRTAYSKFIKGSM